MKKLNVKITTSGMVVLPNGRKVRTPVLLNLSETELHRMKVQFKSRGLKYIIEDISEEFKPPKLAKDSKKVIIEELTPQRKNSAEPKTFLDKLISDE